MKAKFKDRQRIKPWLLLCLLGFVAMFCLAPERDKGFSRAWAQPITFTPTFTPTLTPFGLSPLPTPTKVIKVINEITHPKNGDAVFGFVRIQGYASIDSFRRYDVHIAVAGSESWQWLATSLNPVYDDIIHLLDSTQFPDGLYDVRVRVLRDDGNYTEDFLRGIEIRNANPPTITPALNELGTPLPTPTPTLITPTPTFTPEFISNINDGPGIFYPYNNIVLRGIVKIIGTVFGKPNLRFERYELAISPAGYGEWAVLHSSDEQIWQDTLYKLDTRAFPDGLYDLRLRIVFENGNYDEYEVRNIYIANNTVVNLPTATPTPPTKGIFFPESGSIITGTIAITGTANIPNFQRWELYWTPSGTEAWSLLVNSTTPVTNGLLARLDVSQLLPGFYDLRLRVYNWNGLYEEYFARRLALPEPTPTPTVTPFPTETPPPAP
jgi:hypothetical protein